MAKQDLNCELSALLVSPPPSPSLLLIPDPIFPFLSSLASVPSPLRPPRPRPHPIRCLRRHPCPFIQSSCPPILNLLVPVLPVLPVPVPILTVPVYPHTRSNFSVFVPRPVLYRPPDFLFYPFRPFYPCLRPVPLLPVLFPSNSSHPRPHPHHSSLICPSPIPFAI